MGTFDGRDDALHLRHIFESIDRLVVRHRHVLCPADVVEIGMLRADARVVEAGRDRVNRCDLAILVLAEVGLHAVENAETAGVDRGRRLEGVDASARRLTADELHLRVVDEVVEGADGVRSAADARDDGIREAALLLEHLLLDLLRDHRLKITHDRRKRVWAHDRAEAVVRVLDAARPLTHRLGNRILQGAGAVGDRDHLRSEKAHLVDIERLALRIHLPHENHALHPHERRDRRGRHTVLARTGLCDEAGLAHLLREQRLAEAVVDLVGARVVQVLALQVDLCAAEVLRHLLRIVEAARAARILVEQRLQLRVKRRVILVFVVRGLKLDHRVHQRLRDVLAPVNTESSILICHISSFPASTAVRFL